MDTINIKDNYKILVSGDSISKGVIFNEQSGKYTVLNTNYVALVEGKLRGMVCNAAKFGNTIIKGITRLQNDICKNDPDIVLIEFGGNDCDFNWDEIASDPTAEHSPKTDINVFRNILRDGIRSLNSKNIVPVLMTLPPLDADRYFLWISKNSAAAGNSILKWLGSVTKIYWWHEMYNSAIISIAEETKTRWIDIRGAFLQTADFTRLICIDGIHPNEKGHKVIADAVLDYLKNNYDFLLNDNARLITD